MAGLPHAAAALVVFSYRLTHVAAAVLLLFNVTIM